MSIRYLYLNPVTYNHLKENNIDINKYFKDKGFHLLDIPTHIFKEIKDEYNDLIKSSDDIVVDARCPELKRILHQERPDIIKYQSKIDPIFIRCGRYFFDKYVKVNPNNTLTMVSPCSQLCDVTSISDRVHFLTWIEFKSKYDINLQLDKPISTPLPMGYFKDLNVNTLWLTGSNLEKLYKIIDDNPANLKLVEYLYCNGCHKGDGL